MLHPEEAVISTLACHVLGNVITPLMKAAFSAFRCLLGAACVYYCQPWASATAAGNCASGGQRTLSSGASSSVDGHKCLLLLWFRAEPSVSVSYILFSLL